MCTAVHSQVMTASSAWAWASRVCWHGTWMVTWQSFDTTGLQSMQTPCKHHANEQKLIQVTNFEIEHMLIHVWAFVPWCWFKKHMQKSSSSGLILPINMSKQWILHFFAFLLHGWDWTRLSPDVIAALCSMDDCSEDCYSAQWMSVATELWLWFSWWLWQQFHFSQSIINAVCECIDL